MAKRQVKNRQKHLQGSRLRRDIYRKKLRHLLEISDDEAFFRMAWATFILQFGEPQQAKPFLTYPPEAANAGIGSRYSIHPWMIETMLNEVLITPKLGLIPDHRNRHLDCRQFGAIASVCDALRELENAEDGITLRRVNIFKEMHRLGQRQFEWQRGIATKSQLYRTAFIYGGELSKIHFSDAHGIDLNDFSLACFALYASFRNKPVFMRDGSLASIGIADNKKRDAVFNLISIRHKDARKLASQLRSDNGHIAYKRSLLRLYPCVGFGIYGERIFAPLPDLVILRATVRVILRRH